MNELYRHIETLLLENDCLTVPGLGGFVAHYIPAKYNVENFSFEPPTRIIGFNQQLKMNDGLLVQSYMALYGLSYTDAFRLVEQEIEQLKEKLYIEGEVEIENIGTLSYDIDGHYDFVPLDNLLTTPSLYALGSFDIQPLADAAASRCLTTEKKEKAETHTTILKPLAEKTEKVIEHTVAKHISMWPSYLSGAVATIALIIISFMFSTPLKNTYMDAEGMEAGIITGQSLEDFKKHSLALNTIKIRQIADFNHPESPKTSSANNVKETRILVTSDKKSDIEKVHWLYFPDKDINFYRVGFYDVILDTDKLSMYVEIGYESDFDITSSEIQKQLSLTLDNLARCGIINDHVLLSHNYVIMDPAYVHITEESNSIVGELKHELAKYDVYSIGRYGSWTYCSIEDCIIEAKNLVDRLKR